MTTLVLDPMQLLKSRARRITDATLPHEVRAIMDALVTRDGWTLVEYIEWLNRPEPGVVKGELMAAEEWAEYNITKASELGAYLDACVERERMKDMP